MNIEFLSFKRRFGRRVIVQATEGAPIWPVERAFINDERSFRPRQGSVPLLEGRIQSEDRMSATAASGSVVSGILSGLLLMAGKQTEDQTA